MDTREEIRSRMLRDVARLWGYQDSEMDEKAFDPIVGLLIGACATEFGKLQQEMGNSRQRILDQLASTLTPDVLTTPAPAHAVLHARAIEPETILLPVHQVYHKKKFGKEEKEIYFSPAAPYRVINGAVRYVAAAGKVLKVDNMPFREAVVESDTYKRNWPSPTLWLGLEIHPEIASLNGATFFFNWKNEPRLRSFLRQLPYCRWFVGEHELTIEKGIPEHHLPGQRDNVPPFEAEFSPAWRMKRRANEYYHEHFITITGSKDLSLENSKRPYPEAFERYFLLEDLMALSDKLLWVRVEFPEYFPQDALVSTECQLNCVPVLNKRFHEETYRLQEQVNILPLVCDDYFFDVHRVYNEQENEFNAHPLANLRNLEPGTYTLRARDAGKMDGRAASRHLHHLIDMLRDESAAFAAFDLNYLDAKIKKLNQEITDLEQHVREGGQQREELPYLVVKPPKNGRNQNVKVEFWSTIGERANGISSGTKLDMYATRGFDRDSIQLMTTTTGGTNRKSASDAFYEFKKSLTTRDRVVSKEDIKTFCFATFGERLERVSIQKGAHISDLPHEGVIRTLDVTLVPALQKTPQDAQEWAALCFELQTELNAKSAGLLPIRVLTTAAVAET